MCCNWEEYPDSRNDPDVIVMQGVLEHFDNPWKSLDGIIEKFKPKTIITSMPCFLNPRGIIWMTLDMLGAVMSKTDLHFINPWDVQKYSNERNYKLIWNTIDKDWASGKKMYDDMVRRIPLAIKDGKLPWDANKFGQFGIWFEMMLNWSDLDIGSLGAIAIYRIDL